jgi:hypothetical protein
VVRAKARLYTDGICRDRGETEQQCKEARTSPMQAIKPSTSLTGFTSALGDANIFAMRYSFEANSPSRASLSSRSLAGCRPCTLITKDS